LPDISLIFTSTGTLTKFNQMSVNDRISSVCGR
jgi:hypothetical protein